MQEHKTTDTILMSYNIVEKTIVKISIKTFFKGMKELVGKYFIAETMIQNYYFITPVLNSMVIVRHLLNLIF